MLDLAATLSGLDSKASTAEEQLGEARMDTRDGADTRRCLSPEIGLSVDLGPLSPTKPLKVDLATFSSREEKVTNQDASQVLCVDGFAAATAAEAELMGDEDDDDDDDVL